MKKTVTTSLLPVFLVFGITEAAFAQAGPELGDEFIYFVNGTNTLVPTFDGTIVSDPIGDETNKVMEYLYGNWSYQAFRFQRDVGMDMSQNREDGDWLGVRLRVDPENEGKDKLSIMFEDKTDDDPTMDGSADLPFRLVWRIPEDLRDGEWHELEIPLPPATWQELEDAKDDGTLDPLAEHWVYAGAWSSGGFGVGVSDEMGPHTEDNPDLWEEFEWSNVASLGFFWDNNQGGGPAWLDDVYIGDDETDLDVANEPPAAMSGVTFEITSEGAEISWNHDDQFGGYNVYMSDDPDSRMEQLAYLPFSADEFTVKHRFEWPHWDFQGNDVTYAVTSLSYFGVENTDYSNSSAALATPNVKVQPFIVQLTQDEADALFDDLAAGNVRKDGFPDNLKPFRLNQSHFTLGDTANPPDDDTDNSGVFYLAYADNNELWIYSEVTDNVMEFDTPGSTSAWRFDSVEFGWGNYDVRDQNGESGETNSVLLSVNHFDMQRGDHADYIFRVAPFANEVDGPIVGTTTYIGNSIDAEVPGGDTIADYMTNTDGDKIGYKMLSVIPLDEIQATGDAVLDPPASDEMRVIPMTVSLNDADGSGRESQIIWSIKHNANNFWWREPVQWSGVAMVGNDIRTGVETDPEVPVAFALEQNYPNPFNPATSIKFALPTAERVTLAVYDVMGRRVALLVDDKALSAGTHTMRFDATNLASGLYIYSLQAGTAFTQTKRMILIK